MIKPNPFTPKSGQEPRAFVGREYEINCFRKLLEKAKNDYSDHFLILGDWGIGKTTLLKEFRNAAQAMGILTSLISVRGYSEGDRIHDGIKDLIGHIPHGLPTGVSKLKAYLKQIEALGLQVMGTGVTFTRAADFSPSLLLSDTLVNLWKDLKSRTPVALVLLDDVQNFDLISELFITLRNVLSSDAIVKNTRFLFGLSCTTSMWAQSVPNVIFK